MAPPRRRCSSISAGTCCRPRGSSISRRATRSSRTVVSSTFEPSCACCANAWSMQADSSATRALEALPAARGGPASSGPGLPRQTGAIASRDRSGRCLDVVSARRGRAAPAVSRQESAELHAVRRDASRRDPGLVALFHNWVITHQRRRDRVRRHPDPHPRLRQLPLDPARFESWPNTHLSAASRW